MTFHASLPRQRQHLRCFLNADTNLTVDTTVDAIVNGLGKALTALSTVPSTLKCRPYKGKVANC
jgi:hypothetical protein